MEIKTIMALVLAVLVVFSVVQAFQLKEIKEKVSSGNAVTASVVAGGTARTAGGPATVPSNIRNLPQMVGGC